MEYGVAKSRENNAMTESRRNFIDKRLHGTSNHEFQWNYGFGLVGLKVWQWVDYNYEKILIFTYGTLPFLHELDRLG